MSSGVMPTLHAPTETTPGQLGPMSVTPRRSSWATISTVSRTGMPSVTQTTRPMPASAASKRASFAAGAGTNTTETSAPVAATAWASVSKTGMVAGEPSAADPTATRCPPLPGEVPATTVVPAAAMRAAWKLPSRPVMPWTTTLLEESTRMLTARSRARTLGSPSTRSLSFATATAFATASVSVAIGCKSARPAASSRARPSSALVPTRRTTTGTRAP